MGKRRGKRRVWRPVNMLEVLTEPDDEEKVMLALKNGLKPATYLLSTFEITPEEKEKMLKRYWTDKQFTREECVNKDGQFVWNENTINEFPSNFECPACGSPAATHRFNILIRPFDLQSGFCDSLGPFYEVFLKEDELVSDVTYDIYLRLPVERRLKMDEEIFDKGILDRLREAYPHLLKEGALKFYNDQLYK